MTINSDSSIMPSFLSDHDQIELIAPARSVSKKDIDSAIKIIESNNFSVSYSKNLFDYKDIFSGTKNQRIHAFQKALDNPKTKAIFFVRGGYGAIQIIDDIDFSIFSKNPKWLVGFSDITTILMHVYSQYRINSIHGPMPFNFQKTESLSINNIFNLLRGNLKKIEFPAHKLNKTGITSGILIGGNLSVLCSLIGSPSFMRTHHDTILFIEDVDEYIYHIERMMYMLSRSGFLKRIRGLIVGKMTNIMDNKIAFGQTVYQVIKTIVKQYNYPVCFNAPIGHHKNNNPIIIGSKITLDVNSESSKIYNTK